MGHSRSYCSRVTCRAARGPRRSKVHWNCPVEAVRGSNCMVYREVRCWWNSACCDTGAVGEGGAKSSRCPWIPAPVSLHRSPIMLESAGYAVTVAMGKGKAGGKRQPWILCQAEAPTTQNQPSSIGESNYAIVVGIGENGASSSGLSWILSY